MEKIYEDDYNLAERLRLSQAVSCDFLVGSITELTSGAKMVVLVPTKDGDFSTVFFIMEHDLALQVGEALIATVQTHSGDTVQ